MSTVEHVLPVESHQTLPWQRYLLDSVLASAGTALVTGIIFAFHLYPRIPNISILIGVLKHGREVRKYREEALHRLEEHALLAEDLGAQVIRTSSSDIAMKLVEVARERQITQIVLGQPARSHWEELIRGSIINRLLRLSTDIDIHLVPRSRDE